MSKILTAKLALSETEGTQRTQRKPPGKGLKCFASLSCISCISW